MIGATLRDLYLVPFYLIGQLNTEAWVDNYDKRHRRRINRLNGASIIALLNLFGFFDIYSLAGRSFELPAGRSAPWVLGLIFMAPSFLVLGSEHGEKMITSWTKNLLQYKLCVIGVSVSAYAAISIYFFLNLKA